MATKALFNTAVNWFIRQRIDQIQNFMKHPIETQNGVLFSQLFHAEETDIRENSWLQRHFFLPRFSATSSHRKLMKISNLT